MRQNNWELKRSERDKVGEDTESEREGMAEQTVPSHHSNPFDMQLPYLLPILELYSHIYFVSFHEWYTHTLMYKTKIARACVNAYVSFYCTLSACSNYVCELAFGRKSSFKVSFPTPLAGNYLELSQHFKLRDLGGCRCVFFLWGKKSKGKLQGRFLNQIHLKKSPVCWLSALRSLYLMLKTQCQFSRWPVGTASGWMTCVKADKWWQNTWGLTTSVHTNYRQKADPCQV